MIVCAYLLWLFFFLRIRRPPRSTRTDTLFPDTTLFRSHYVITDGGAAPNVVPASASVYYYVRHPEPGVVRDVVARLQAAAEGAARGTGRSEEHTSELQSLMRISYAVFCLKKKT